MLQKKHTSKLTRSQIRKSINVKYKETEIDNVGQTLDEKSIKKNSPLYLMKLLDNETNLIKMIVDITKNQK